MRRFLVSMALGGMLLCSVGGCTPAPTTPNPAQAVAGPRFSGSWETSYGRLTLVVDGTRVTGNYGGTGRITGTLSEDGQTVTGTWAEPPNLTGGVHFSLSEDGSRLIGRWTERGGIGQSTDWIGTRTP